MNDSKPIRAAIYTRKSSEEGLEQGFNSLDAQREAGEAYVRSQAGLGWTLVPKAYDDGGYSGGTLERPALKTLLEDIAKGEIDIVVVYKLDRLSRSISDFGRIVEVLDKAGAEFVSVTQPVNTTSSMGRLMVHVLLSFAQFEREVTGERIRDKIAASKAKGRWMGGNLPLGYDPAGDNRLEVNPAEAETVRMIFAHYLELGSVHKLVEELDRKGIRSKAWVSSRGKAMGGVTIGRGAMFHMLRNPLYRGLIRHKDKTFPGNHPAIIDEAVFNAVQAMLDANQVRKRRSATKPAKATLTGKIIGADGAPMTPTFATGRRGRIYRYFVSAKLQRGGSTQSGQDGPRRIPADALEAAILEWLRRISGQSEGTWDALGSLLLRVEIKPDQTHLVLDADALFGDDHPSLAFEDLQARLGDAARVVWDKGKLRIAVPMSMRFRGGRTWVQNEINAGQLDRFDRPLILAVRSGHDHLYRLGAPPWADRSSWCHARGDQSTFTMKLCRLALLAPDIQQSILAGRVARSASIHEIVNSDIPLSWADQREWWKSITSADQPPRVIKS